MIYVKIDPNLFPPRILTAAINAQKKLETLSPTERKEFIKKKANIWKSFARHLSAMSYGKCWYSESKDAQSFSDVDHFRPKNEAKRTKDFKDDGYPWLAFSWENFRYAAQRSNQLSTDEDTDEVVGKGSWFPLLNNSPRASWGNRCEADELPVLLDPAKASDVNLIEVKADGMMGPSKICIGSSIERVERSIELYGLNLPDIKRARAKIMRDVNTMCEVLFSMLDGSAPVTAIADKMPIVGQVALIKETTHPKSPYSRAARTQLRLLGMVDICVQPEEIL